MTTWCISAMLRSASKISAGSSTVPLVLPSAVWTSSFEVAHASCTALHCGLDGDEATACAGDGALDEQQVGSASTL